MNDQSSLERHVADWLRGDAPTQAPSRVLSAALAEVARADQERPFGRRRFDAWIGRSPRLHWTIVGVVLAAALLGAIVGVGALLRQTQVRPLDAAGGWVAFTVGDGLRGGNSAIYLVREGVLERRLTGTYGDGLRRACPSFSPDGSKLAYSETAVGATRADSEAAVVVNVDGGGSVTPMARLPKSSVTDVCPKWAPDGRSVAFIAQTPSVDGIEPELWIGRLDGTAVPVGGWPAKGGPIEFDWSPDGTAVVAPGGVDGSIWVVPIDGRPGRRVSARPGIQYEHARWSPDGTRIAAVAEDFVTYPDGSGAITGASVEVDRADGSGSPILLADADFGAGVAWSPDGGRIAYVREPGSSNPAGMTELLTVAPDGSDARVAASAPGHIGGFIWSPDGSQLLYVVAGDDALGSLWLVSVGAVSAPVRLTQQPFNAESTGSNGMSWQATPRSAVMLDQATPTLTPFPTDSAAPSLRASESPGPGQVGYAPGTIAVTVGAHALGAGITCQALVDGGLSVLVPLTDGDAVTLTFRFDGTVSSLSGALPRCRLERPRPTRYAQGRQDADLLGQGRHQRRGRLGVLRLQVGSPEPVCRARPPRVSGPVSIALSPAFVGQGGERCSKTGVRGA